MDVTRHLEALQRDLIALAAVGDPEHAEVVRRISAALEPALRLRLLEVLSEAAHELDGQLPGSVELRLAGAEPSLVYAEGEPEARPSLGDDALSLSSRITLRLAETLKAAVEVALDRLDEPGVDGDALLRRGRLDRRLQGLGEAEGDAGRQ